LERAKYLQEKSCDIFHHVLIMLLHYLGKLKQFRFAANLEKNANKMYQFLYACIIMDLAYLLIYYFRLWFLLNIF